MDITDRATLLESGERVLAMVELLRAFVAGQATRAEVRAWAWSVYVYGVTTFPGHSEAEVVLGCLLNFDDRREGTQARRDGLADPYVVRVQDAEGYLRWLTGGNVHLPRYSLIDFVGPSLEVLASRLHVPTVRHLVHGIGWDQLLEFSSPLTGRAFVANGGGSRVDGLPCDREGSIMVYTTKLDPRPADLLDTLAIDLDDLTHFSGTPGPTEELGRWQLWRQDDNGQKVCIQTFSGLAKARAHLRRFEALHHKQIYWLE
jgi:hypothetical protein